MTKETPVMEETQEQAHPMDELLRMDRMPHIWCPTCGLGIVVTALALALEKSGVPLDDVAVVSGIGCTGRVAGYIKVDSFHTTHGRAIPFATGLHLANPKLKVIVVSGDGDLIAIGGNHFIHAARRNIDITVICANNFIYAMTGGQVAPTTPLTANASTMPYGNFEPPFNIPYLADSCGASYVARWSSLHVRRMTTAFAEAIAMPGFSVVEVVTPCSTLYARRNRLGTGLDLLKFYHDNCKIEHGADTRSLDIEFQSTIILGKFLERRRPTFLEQLDNWYGQVFGDEYEPYAGAHK